MIAADPGENDTMSQSLLARLTRHKSIEQLQADLGQRHDFRRVLGLWQLTAIGLGGIIGVGVFVLAGQQAAANAGPAVALAFVIAGIASAAAALCYAEFAGMIPVTGSAYTYGYAVLGEFPAWLTGWDLSLEYALIVAVVASGWACYVQNFRSITFSTSLEDLAFYYRQYERLMAHWREHIPLRAHQPAKV